MFILTTLSDVVQIEPEDFNKPSATAIEDNLNCKYANKIIFRVGLCICFYDLCKASYGLVGHGTGTVNVKVEFRMIVFRPFKGEIIEGTLHGNYPDGIRIHLEFFDDITVPCPVNIFPNSHFKSGNAGEKFWIWMNEDSPTETEDHGAPEDAEGFYFEANDRVRFRVEEEIWTDLVPGDEDRLLREEEKLREQRQQLLTVDNQAVVGNGGEGSSHDDGGESDDDMYQSNDTVVGRTKTAWRIVASMQQGGLGPVDWW